MAEPEKVAGCEALPLRLRWRQTWPDKDADYIADADGYIGGVGRVCRYEHGTQQGTWFWAMNAHDPEINRNADKLQGVERSPRATARMVENAWFATINGSLDRPPSKGNAYAMTQSGNHRTNTIFATTLAPSISNRSLS